MKNKDIGIIILSIALALGLIIGGYFIFKGLKSFSDKDRIVTVKGLAEQEIDALRADIIISTSFSGDNPSELIKKVEERKEAILKYLKEKEFNAQNITSNDIDIYDSKEYYRYDYGMQKQVKVDRYKMNQDIIIKTDDVVEAEKTKSELEIGLIQKNLSSDIRTKYHFPELNSIKPALIAESTKNARTAGEQFANDSKSKLGKIKTASQGQISVVGKYYYDDDSKVPEEAYKQKVRVVSTIVFFLED